MLHRSIGVALYLFHQTGESFLLKAAGEQVLKIINDSCSKARMDMKGLSVSKSKARIDFAYSPLVIKLLYSVI